MPGAELLPSSSSCRSSWDENINESDIEALEQKPFLVATKSSGGTMDNKLDLRNPRYFVPVIFIVLTSSTTILTVWSKRAGKYEYSVTTMNFLVEALKCVLSLVAALFKIWRDDDITQDNKLSMSSNEVSVYPIPAALNLIEKLLQYYIFAYVDAQTYQISKYINIFGTGVLYSFVLKEELKISQWFALFQFCNGFYLAHTRPSYGTVSLQDWVMAIAMAPLSAFAGVFTEAIIKKHPSRNINVQNLWFYIFGMMFNFAAIFVQDFDVVISKGFFHGYSLITVYTIICHALSGIAFSMVLKYADSVVMVGSTCVAKIIAEIISMILFGLPTEPKVFEYSILGSMLVFVSAFLYVIGPTAMDTQQKLR